MAARNTAKSAMAILAMAEEGKKISFGFSKTVKKPLVKNVAPVEEKKLDYIECVDDKAIKIIGKEEKKNEPLVIPMLGSKTWHDRIINKVDADIFEPKPTEALIKEETNNTVEIEQEQKDTTQNGNAQNESGQPMEIDGVRIKEEPKDAEPSTPITLEQQAAQEILADLKAKDNESKEQKSLTVPISEDDLKGKEESTLEDYENIPIESFGLAMLRGMGWKEELGVGKNAKVIAPSIPELRPKGMGLGADKLAIQKTKAKLTKEEENLKIVRGCCVKIIAGKKSGNYGKIEGLDEDTGRILVRLALGNGVVSLVNELLVQPVTNEEYSKNSRVLNMKAYEDHKNNEENNVKKENDVKKSKKERVTPENSEDSSDDEHKRSKKSSKKSKIRKDESSEDESSSEIKKRRKRDSSNSSEEHTKRKNSKKSKKHKSRDSSSERSSRKNKKKDKEREKSRHKKSDYSDSSEKARNRDRRRSRSRSHSPRNRRRNRSRS